ncbi:hypothetical protein [Pantoea sp. App145]|uniref:hypothetical protein n=1 Tax=Pantoea sp. App145 TaxID=3071567 RepID=UPI003A80E1EA
MGFPSPVNDYVEPRLDLNQIFMPNRANTFMIETATGCLLVDQVVKVRPGDLVVFQIDGCQMIGKWYPKYLMTDDGIIEADALENVIVLGVVRRGLTRFACPAGSLFAARPNCPTGCAGCRTPSGVLTLSHPKNMQKKSLNVSSDSSSKLWR